MKKIKFKILSLIQKFRTNISILLLAALLVLIFFEILVIKRAVSTVLDISRANPAVQASQLVRVNFSAYDKVVNRIESAPGFSPRITIQNNPFGIGEGDKAKGQ
jgi:hypothetical protein